MADDLPLICERADAAEPVFDADEVARWPAGALDRLTGLGLLRPAAHAAAVACAAGHTDHVEAVTAFEYPVGTGLRAYLRCPVAGRVEVPLRRLRRWEVDLEGLCGAVAGAGGITGGLSSAIPPWLWRLGRATWAGRPREVFFLRSPSPAGRPAVAKALTSHPRAVLLLSTESAVQGWQGTTGNDALALESLLTLDASGLWLLDRAYLAARLADAGPPPRRKSGRRRGPRAAKIERLVTELKSQLKAARDHAVATRDATGVPQLLPRPSEKELAGRTGMKDYDVTRCLQDPKARELQIYWDMADDLNQILGWTDPGPGAAAD